MPGAGTRAAMAALVKARRSAQVCTLRLSQISTMFPPGSWRWAATRMSRYSGQVNAFVSPLRPR